MNKQPKTAMTEIITEACRFLKSKNITSAATDQLKSLRVLFPEEQKYIKDSVPIRQQEFATSRWCARRALNKLGIKKPGTILMGKNGEPLWPQDTVGSITHQKGICCAMTALTSDYLSLGLDVEPVDKLIDSKTWKIIANEDEIIKIKQSGKKTGQLKLLVFSAKESLFKLLFPLINRTFSFDAASVCLSETNPSNQFIIKLRKELHPRLRPGNTLYGYYFTDQKWLLTLLFLLNL